MASRDLLESIFLPRALSLSPIVLSSTMVRDGMKLLLSFSEYLGKIFLITLGFVTPPLGFVCLVSWLIRVVGWVDAEMTVEAALP